jgi:hypothetical protein
MASDKKVPLVRTLSLISGEEFDRFSALHSVDVSLITRIRDASRYMIQSVTGLDGARTSKYIEIAWKPSEILSREQLRELNKLMVVWKQVHLEMDEKKLSFPSVSSLVAMYDQRRSCVLQGWEVRNMRPHDTNGLTFIASVKTDDQVTREAQHVATYIEKYSREAA